MLYLKRILFIISVLLLPSLRTDSHSIQDHKVISSTKIDNPGNDISPLPNRRQNPGKTQQYRLRSDTEIARLLNAYRGIVKKYGHESPKGALQGANYGLQNQPYVPANDTDRFYIGQKGPIRHNPYWSISKSTDNARNLYWSTSKPTMARQGAEYDYDDFKQQGNRKEKENPDHGGGGNIEVNEEKTNPHDIGKGTTQNEAMGAASRFTTRMTTTRRRRRTTPLRVSFAEDCDYIAYYCLKAYDTGKVCARTLYFIHMTFTNYCMVDYVNCMERYDIWQIAHMGECFELKVLTEYLHYPYNDDYFLDNYYIIEDM